MERPISMEMKTTPKKAPIQATKSNLSIFHINIMMAARIALGVYLNKGVITSNVSKTTIDITMFDTAVLHPAITRDPTSRSAMKKNCAKEKQTINSATEVCCTFACLPHASIF
ncbi:hypothetical protein MIMGU_mgv1a024528mg [Erythranthe guttata]|uniref:Uncharacterized protein n=1 Tax=Erythranthe guttata TaxID=4155 RepID=A0A022Q6T0_ERYGU|nr:hypothetical protein MIMGU_mgv1a024528mg [Erythranthe guttata]